MNQIGMERERSPYLGQGERIALEIGNARSSDQSTDVQTGQNGKTNHVDQRSEEEIRAIREHLMGPQMPSLAHIRELRRQRIRHRYTLGR